MSGKKRAALISEVGWRGIKDFSSALLKNGLLVDIIVRGNVDKEVLDVITRPRGLRIVPVAQSFFRIYLFFYLLWHKMLGDIDVSVVSRDRTKRWVKNLGFDAKLLVETNNGYDFR